MAGKFPYTMAYIIIVQHDGMLIQTTITDSAEMVIETKNFKVAAGRPATETYAVMKQYLRQRVLQDLTDADLNLTGKFTMVPEDAL